MINHHTKVNLGRRRETCFVRQASVTPTGRSGFMPRRRVKISLCDEVIESEID